MNAKSPSMRRSRMSRGWCHRVAAGRTQSVISSRRRPQSPSPCSSASTGLGPSDNPATSNARSASHSKGNEQSRNRSACPPGNASAPGAQRSHGRRSIVLAQVHARVERGHLVGVAIEGQRRLLRRQTGRPRCAAPAPGSSAGGPRSGSRWRRTRTRAARRCSRTWAAAVSVKRISTIDLMPLKPYFQGTTSRSGAPFWFGRDWP